MIFECNFIFALNMFLRQVLMFFRLAGLQISLLRKIVSETELGKIFASLHYEVAF